MGIFRYLFLAIVVILFGCSTVSLNSPAPEDNRQMKDSNEDFKKIVRLILDYPDLQEYFHAEIPERMHLRIVKEPSFPEHLAISKFGNPVKYLEKEEISEGDNYIEFSQLNVEDNKAQVEFIYPIEGVVGTVFLSKRDDTTWVVQNINIVER